MIQSPSLLLTIVAFICVIGPLVFVHEMGHYWAARLFGVKIDAFSIGMGREVAGWTDKRGTRWKLGWAPVGGYVRFAGDMNAVSQPTPEWLMLPAAERARTFQAKPVWQRAIIVAAGPAVNFLTAFLILAGCAIALGEVHVAPVIGQVVPGSAAQAAGLAPNDRIAAIDGSRIGSFDQISAAIMLRGGDRVRIDFDRAGALRSTSVVVRQVVEKDEFGNKQSVGRLGILPDRNELTPVRWYEAPGLATQQIRSAMSLTVTAVGRVLTGRTPLSVLHGPVGTAKMAGERMAVSWPDFVFFVALVSINLGFINLLPVPMLDGGHLLFYAIEAVRRRPVAPDVQEWAYRGGLAALLALMLLVTVNDLASFGLWSRLAGLVG